MQLFTHRSIFLIYIFILTKYKQSLGLMQNVWILYSRLLDRVSQSILQLQCIKTRHTQGLQDHKQTQLCPNWCSISSLICTIFFNFFSELTSILILWKNLPIVLVETQLTTSSSLCANTACNRDNLKSEVEIRISTPSEAKFTVIQSSAAFDELEILGFDKPRDFFSLSLRILSRSMFFFVCFMWSTASWIWSQTECFPFEKKKEKRTQKLRGN